jgi:hypothetical protein
VLGARYSPAMVVARGLLGYKVRGEGFARIQGQGRGVSLGYGSGARGFTRIRVRGEGFH